MAQRVFGPVRGAGVQIVEREGEKPIEAGALGIVGYAGILEKGPTNTLIGPITSDKRLAKVVGGIIPDSVLPDACQDYLQLARGAGGILLVRVTDGNERAAGGYYTFANAAQAVNLFSRRSTRTPFGTVKAKNGGRWGGRKKNYTDEFALAGDLTDITLDTGLAKFASDEWKGGWIELDEVANKRYPIVGNTAAGVLTVEPDQTMAADLAASANPANFRYYLVLDDTAEKRLTIELRDGEENPGTEFGMFVYVDGDLVGQYPNLSIDPNSSRYWVNLINNDGNNDEIVVTDVFTGARTADVRPANAWGVIDTVTTLILTGELIDVTVNSPTNANPTVAAGATDDAMLEQQITVTMTSPTAFDAVSDRFGALGSGTVGVLFTPDNKWSPPFTITNGATVLATGDVLVINYKPFVADELIGGFVYPDKVNEPRLRFRIVDNDHDSITVATGSDLTNSGAITAGAEFMVQAPLPLQDGRDGIADLVDSDFSAQAWDTDSSPFKRVVGRNFGLVKFATPGVTATAVQKAGIAYAEALNHQYREEVPANIVMEEAADAYVNDTIGRSDYAVVSWPSYGDVPDPLGGTDGKLKRISLTGMIHGREARIAADNLGYHKAEAGIDATLPRLLAIPTGDTVLNEELLNPRGIGVVKKKQGNFVLWGDRTLWRDPAWKFKHQRELMSYYEQVLAESFDFIVFGLNNSAGRATVRTSLVSFFLPEYNKGALDTDVTFTEAAQIKIDRENNTDVVKAAGDMVTEITLKLADVVERLRIIIGKRGVFEAVG